MTWRSVIVDRRKLLDYLLSQTHPVGRSKAKFFRGVGFDEKSIETLEQGLVRIAQSGEVRETTPTPHGTKRVIDGILDTPGGSQVTLRTVWIEDEQGEVLRLVTAYPAG